MRQRARPARMHCTARPAGRDPRETPLLAIAGSRKSLQIKVRVVERHTVEPPKAVRRRRPPSPNPPPASGSAGGWMLHPLEQRLWSPGFAPSEPHSSFNSRICGPFDPNPSSTTTSAKSGAHAARNRRFAALLSQSFFFRPSDFTIASGATTGTTSRRCGSSAQRLVVVRRRPVLVTLLAAVRNASTEKCPVPSTDSKYRPSSHSNPASAPPRCARANSRLNGARSSLGSTSDARAAARPTAPAPPRTDCAGAAARAPTSPTGVLLELQQRRVLQREYRQPRHQTVRQAQPTARHLVLDPLEAASHLRQQPRHRQRLAKLRLVPSLERGIAPIMGSESLRETIFRCPGASGVSGNLVQRDMSLKGGGESNEK